MRIRATDVRDGAKLWQLVRDSEALELNSEYFYVLMSAHFSDTCRIAEDDEGRPAGFVVGHRPPSQPDTVFVWQVGVADHARRQGLAGRLLDDLVDGLAASGVRWLEATVTPDNEASGALFRGFARRRDVPCDVRPFLTSDLFFGDHEPEELFRIGPIEPTGSAERTDTTLQGTTS